MFIFYEFRPLLNR